MKQFSITRIATAAAVAALSVSVFVQASFAAELDAASIPSASIQAASTTVSAPELGRGCSYANQCVVAHSTDGWLLDSGGPALQFVSVDE